MPMTWVWPSARGTWMRVFSQINNCQQKTKEKNSYPHWEPNPNRWRMKSDISPLGHERLLIFWVLILILISFFATSCLSAWKCWCFSWQNVFRTPWKPWLWTEKPNTTSSTIFGVETAAKSCELKRCADRVRIEPTRQIWTFRLNFIA